MCLEIVSRISALFSLAIFVFVGMILQFNNEDDPKNFFNKQKGWIINHISRHKGFGWTGKPKAITRLLLGAGFILLLVNIVVSW
ncbi:hypothetical protein ES707_16338 [subsurface metagenome]